MLGICTHIRDFTGRPRLTAWQEIEFIWRKIENPGKLVA
jgi:hypothetical protein